MHASVDLRRRSRTSAGDASRRIALEVAVESLAIPHEGAAAAASACGSDAAFEFGLAQGACGLEAAVGGGFARRQKGLGRCVRDDARVGPERAIDELRA